MSVLFGAPRPITYKGLALIGVISATLLVGASAMPTSVQSPPPRRAQADAVIGSDGPTGSPAQFRLKEERDRVVLRFTDQLVYLESVFANATPGSPA